MRFMSGSLKSTPLQWLPILCSITPPKLRREQASQRHLDSANSMSDAHCEELWQTLLQHHAWSIEDLSLLIDKADWIWESWKWEWRTNIPRDGDHIEDPDTPLPGSNLHDRINQHSNLSQMLWYSTRYVPCQFFTAHLLRCSGDTRWYTERRAVYLVVEQVEIRDVAGHMILLLLK